MQVRFRRLQAEYECVVATFDQQPAIGLVGTEGEPPEKYAFELHVNGLVPNDEGPPTESGVHGTEVFLPLDYPRRPPFCRMTTPVFHPNIDAQKICIGDHWSAGQSLTQLVVRIAEMVCYQSYNVKSPLNAQAAVWAQENVDRLPLQEIDLTAGL